MKGLAFWERDPLEILDKCPVEGRHVKTGKRFCFASCCQDIQFLYFLFLFFFMAGNQTFVPAPLVKSQIRKERRKWNTHSLGLPFKSSVYLFGREFEVIIQNYHSLWMSVEVNYLKLFVTLSCIQFCIFLLLFYVQREVSQDSTDMDATFTLPCMDERQMKILKRCK